MDFNSFPNFEHFGQESEKVIDFVGFPGIDGFRLFFKFCSKLPEIARNVKNLKK